MEGATQPPGASAITQVFNGCTFVIHIGSSDDFLDILRDLVNEGLITPQAAEELRREEQAHE